MKVLKRNSTGAEMMGIKMVFMKSFDEDGQEFVNFMKHLGKTMPSDALTSCSWTLA